MKKGQLIQEIDLGKDVLVHDYSETIFLIGRSKDCHIVLDDKKISREHAKIIHENGKWMVERNDPDNALKVNGDDVKSHRLEVDDVVSIDNFKIVINSIDPLQPTRVTSFSSGTASKVVPDQKKEKPETKYDHNATAEINIHEKPGKKIDDDVEYLDNPEDDRLDNLGTRGELNRTNELPAENFEEPGEMSDFVDQDDSPEELQEALPEESDKTSYSLENIDDAVGMEDEGTKVIQSFASVYLELSGKPIPYDRYVLDAEKTFIGRDPHKCQIVLSGPEVSAVHAVITKNNISLMLEDLNSANGTIHHGDRINKVALGHNEEFSIGNVTFTVKISSEFLRDENAILMAVDDNQTIEVEEVVEEQVEDGEELDALGGMVSAAPVEKSILKRIWKNEEQRKKLIYGIVVLIGAWFLFGDEDEAPVAPTKNKVSKSKQKTPATSTSQKKLSDEQRRALSALYEIGKTHYQNGRYREALNELQKIAIVDPNFNSSLQSLIALSKEGLSKIEEEEKKRQEELLLAEKKAKVKKLLEDARVYTKERRVDLANITFNEITKLEPENLEVTRLKLELDDWQREEQRKALEEAAKKKDRDDKLEKLKPGKTFYLQKEWFKAISKLEEFLKIKDMDDDLTTEATDMLKTSRDELSAAVAPLIGKAKSLLEGQDLKGAYEVYQQILRVEPSNIEALNQVVEIKEQLETRARKIYREAIISESLSLFQDAKEKFQEVQQISPVDSDYYKKASEKIKDYLE